MKGTSLIFFPQAILLILAVLFFAIPDGKGQSSLKTGRGIQIPADLNDIFTKSCMPCHSDGGKEMAKVLLNFSRWDKYGRRAQVQKSRSVCRMITKGEMPPAPFIESSPELALTKAQKEAVCKWVSSLVVKKE